MKQRIRDIIVRIIRDELIAYIEQHEDVFMKIFHEEMVEVNERMNTHNYIKVQLEVVGEHMIGAILRTLKRFLQEAPEE